MSESALIRGLLLKVKSHLILTHNKDDELLLRLIAAAVNYAEGFQHLASGFYGGSDTQEAHPLTPTTEQGVVMLACHFYESRDGSTGGFFSDSIVASGQVWHTVNLLLRLDRDWNA